jgi:hypothetical protein
LQPTCPVCRAALTEDPACYRCRADLSTLFELRSRAELLLSRARGEYGAGRFSRALALTRESLSLCRSESARELETLLLFRTGGQLEVYARWRGAKVGEDIDLAELLEQIPFPSTGEGQDDTAADEPELGQVPYLSGPPARRCPESAETNGQTVKRRGGSILTKTLSYLRNRVARFRRRSK